MRVLTTMRVQWEYNESTMRVYNYESLGRVNPQPKKTRYLKTSDKKNTKQTVDHQKVPLM